MRILSNYKIEYNVEKNHGLYSFFLYLAPVLRALAIVMIIPAITVNIFFVIGICVSVAISIVCDNVVKKYGYTLVYSWYAGVFSVIRVDGNGREYIDEIIQCEQIEKIIIDNPDDIKEDAFDISLTLKVYPDKTLCVSVDKYMYALLENGRSDDGLLR